MRKLVRPLSRIATLWFTLRDPGTPRWVKILVLLVCGYILLPFDFIPDAIPVIGWLDDLAAGLGGFGILSLFAEDPAREKASAVSQRFSGHCMRLIAASWSALRRLIRY